MHPATVLERHQDDVCGYRRAAECIDADRIGDRVEHGAITCSDGRLADATRADRRLRIGNLLDADDDVHADLTPRPPSLRLRSGHALAGKGESCLDLIEICLLAWCVGDGARCERVPFDESGVLIGQADADA